MARATPGCGSPSRRISTFLRSAFRVKAVAGSPHEGHAAAVEQFGALLTGLEARLRDDDPDRAILVGDDAATTLRAFTATRRRRAVVHADDLADSVGAAIPPPSADASEIARSAISSPRPGIGWETRERFRALAGRATPMTSVHSEPTRR